MRRAPEADYVLDDLLAETRLSQSSLAFKFKQLVGLPPHAFLIACRIRRAKELLERTDRTVLEIASELKFSSSQHFATRFKQETGFSPNAWRRRTLAADTRAVDGGACLGRVARRLRFAQRVKEYNL